MILNRLDSSHGARAKVDVGNISLGTCPVISWVSAGLSMSGITYPLFIPHTSLRYVGYIYVCIDIYSFVPGKRTAARLLGHFSEQTKSMSERT